jgi:AhpD family alkylhydroperoxidase
MNMTYPEYLKHIQRMMGAMARERQGPVQAIGQLHQAALAEGALSPKVKELVALAIATDVECEGCIAQHLYGALEAGATKEEVVEVIGIVMMMHGGPGVVRGIKTFEALNQFMEAQQG